MAWITIAAWAGLVFVSPPALAQEVMVYQSAPGPGGRAQASPAAAQPAAQAQAAAEAAKAEAAKKEAAGEKKEEGKKPEGDEAKKESDSIKRPDAPPNVPDPRELQVELEDGRVPPFNFIGQPWPSILQWLANISNSSLDWQELPSDYANLTTQRSYSVDEVRDLINRHLHARGYTAIHAGEVLSVFKIDKLDPSMVRRVSEDELYDLKPYDFVKVSFELPQGMDVDKAKEDVKQVLSPAAKVFPLVTTKRILVLDAVANLRTVSNLLNEERAVQDGRVVPIEFVLKHARAEDVINVLYMMIGLDPKSRPSQMELQLQQKRMELMTQMQQRGTDVSKMLKTDGPPVYLAFNRQRNSVLVNAPPEQFRIIEQTIQYLDVPYGGGDEPDAELSTAAGGGRQFKKYHLATLSPDQFVMTLQEIGGLDPRTELRADEASSTLFVQASLRDHQKIEGLIDQFDGAGRQFEVMQLRRLPADAVAATIQSLMVGQEEKKEETNRYPYFYSYGGRDTSSSEKKPNAGFRVDADIENNRLLLWANEAELAEVRKLLGKLGEVPGQRADPRPMRFIEPSNGLSSEELVEQIRNAWSAMGKNELIINLPEKSKAAPKPEPPQEDKPEEESSPIDRSASVAPPARVPARFVQTEQLDSPDRESFESAVASEADAGTGSDIDTDAGTDGDEEEPAPRRAAAPAPAEERPVPPVTITVTEDGRILVTSPDMAALDELEELAQQLTPPEKRFRVFRLQNTTALNMYWNLTDFFKEELESERGGSSYDWYWGFRPSSPKQERGTGLSQRRKLLISYDTPSNTILVANASASQLREIEQLIAEYDRPAPADSVRTRRTAAVKVKYSRASVIADALKEVYRDLLSSRDKEFASADQRQGRGAQERVTVIRYGDSGSDSGSQRPSPVKVGFEGALSVGVDDISNMIIVSVQEELFESVVAMIERLDEEAKPNATVVIHRINGGVTAEALQDVLDDAVSRPWPGGRPEERNRGGARGGGGGERNRGDGNRGRNQGGERRGRG